MRRLTVFVVLVAFIFSSGGQWPVLQCVAWANMIREYSEMVPLTEAVQMTFSGKYPCSMCKAIAEKTNSEQQQKIQELDKHEKKLLPISSVARCGSFFTVIAYPDFVVFLHGRHEAPPTPPPQAALI